MDRVAPDKEAAASRVGETRGWTDVVGLGVDMSGLQALELTGRTQRRFGFEFVEWHSAPGAPPHEVWWSDESAVPLHVAGVRAESVVEITALRLGVERKRLIEPRERFAGYGVVDVAHYREEHHDAFDAPARSPSVPALDERIIRRAAPSGVGSLKDPTNSTTTMGAVVTRRSATSAA